MKTCSKCKLNKDLLEFAKNSTKSDGLQTVCRSCKKSYNQGYYATTKQVHNPARKARKQEQRKLNQANLKRYLSTKACSDCKTSDWRVLEFDHLRDKKYGISQMMDRSWESILTEVQKCEIVCKNCHAIRTYERCGSYRIMGV